MTTAMPRINIDIPAEVHRAAKSEAALQGVPLRDYVVRALEETAARDAQAREQTKPKRKR